MSVGVGRAVPQSRLQLAALAGFLSEAVELVGQLHGQDFIFDFDFAVADGFNIMNSRERLPQIKRPGSVNELQAWHRHSLGFHRNKGLAELELKVACLVGDVEVVFDALVNFFPVELKATPITTATHDADEDECRIDVDVEEDPQDGEDIEEQDQEVPLIEGAAQFPMLVLVFIRVEDALEVAVGDLGLSPPLFASEEQLRFDHDV